MSDIKKAAQSGDTDYKNRYNKRQNAILKDTIPSDRAKVKNIFHAHTEDVERVIGKYQKEVDSGKIDPIREDSANSNRRGKIEAIKKRLR